MGRILFLILLLHIGALSTLWAGWPWTEWWIDGDYGHYYASALRLVEGENPYRGELVDILVPLGFQIEAVEIRATNPPGLILFSIPFTFFPPAVSFWIWNVFQLLIFSLGAIVFVRTALPDMKRTHLALASLALLVSVPLIGHLRHGQTQLLIVGISMLGLALLKKRVRTGSFLLGFAASLKLFTAPLLILTLRTEERVTAMIWSLVGLLLFPVIAESITAESIHLYYISHTLPFVTELALSIAQEVSLTFFVFYSLAISFPQNLSPEEIRATYGPIARSFSLLLLIGVVALDYLRSRRADCVLWSGALLLVACVLFAPVAWPHYMVTLFPLFLLLWNQYDQENSHRGKISLIILYTFVATTFGCISSPHIATVWITAAWGPAVMLVLLGLGFRSKRVAHSE